MNDYCGTGRLEPQMHSVTQCNHVRGCVPLSRALGGSVKKRLVMISLWQVRRNQRERQVTGLRL